MRSNNKTQKASDLRNEKKLYQFIEELAWLLERNSDINFKTFSKNINGLLSKQRESSKNNESVDSLKEFIPDNPNRLFLVGILPSMFTDEKLFQSNEDIADFAQNVLLVSIPRWEKKSKYELIGHIVCNTTKADDKKLSDIAVVLKRIAGNDMRAKNFMAQKRSEKRTWNEIIQQMIDGKV